VYLGVYELLDDKDELPVEGEDPMTYIGSGTQAERGVKARVRNHELGTTLPRYVAAMLDLGYTRTSTTVMLSIPMPKIKLIYARAFIRLMEATLTYRLWTLYCTQNDNHHYVMERLSLWDRRDLAWGGLCSHTPLLESLTVGLPDIDHLADSLGWTNVAEQYEEFSKQMAERQLNQQRERSRRVWQKLNQGAAAGGVVEKERLEMYRAGATARQRRLRASAKAGDKEAEAKVRRMDDASRALRRRRRELAEAGDQEELARRAKDAEKARLKQRRIWAAARTGNDEKAQAEVEEYRRKQQKWKQGLREAAAAGDEKAKAKYEEKKKKDREREQEKRRAIKEAAAAGDEEARAKDEERKKKLRDRARERQRALKEAAAAGDEEAQAKVEKIKKAKALWKQKNAKRAKGL
jgi:hypothetical protein